MSQIKAFFIAYDTINNFLGILLNIFLLCLTAQHWQQLKHLPSNRTILLVIIVDTVFQLTLLPFTLWYLIDPNQTLQEGVFPCYYNGAVSVFFLFLSLSSLVVCSYERYLKIVKGENFDKRALLRWMALATFLCGMVLVGFPMFLGIWFKPSAAHLYCTAFRHSSYDDHAINDGPSNGLVIVNFFVTATYLSLCLVLLSIMYWKIYRFVWSAMKKANRHNVITAGPSGLADQRLSQMTFNARSTIAEGPRSMTTLKEPPGNESHRKTATATNTTLTNTTTLTDRTGTKSHATTHPST